MAYPADTLIEAAIVNIELVLVENPLILGNREAVGTWRNLLRHIEARVDDGATGYDALTQKSDSLWIAEKNFGAS